MPELPEVEAAARNLDRFARGRRIAAAELLRPRLAPHSTPEDFAARLARAAIGRVHRRGKNILFEFDTDTTLLVHLRMSGRFSFLNAEDENPKFTHAVFHFEDGERLVFDDQRHFGLMKIIPTGGLAGAPEILRLAPEPFTDDFSIAYLSGQLKRSKRTLKEFLLDQTKVCGLGNIYASEAMFAAGLDPRKPAAKLTRPRIARLHGSILDTLQRAIDRNTARESKPRDLEGAYAEENTGWAVYDREGAPCRTCTAPIVRLKQGGRSTYFCKKCQRG